MLKPHKIQHWTAGICCLAAPVVWVCLSSFGFSLFAGETLPSGLGDVVAIFRYYGWTDKRFNLAQVISGAAVLIGLISLLAAVYKDRRSLHGEARFASEKEIRNAALYADKGIIIGKNNGKYLVFGGQQFVQLFAPTRSGKGVGVVIPNLLNYTESVVLLDLKLENWRLTSKYRREVLKQDVYLFAPYAEDKRSHAWNPLDAISRDPDFMVGGVLSMAQIFYPSNPSDKNRFWNDQAQNLFLGITLYLIETKHARCTLGEVFRQGSGYDKPLKDHLTALLESSPNLSRACKDALNRVLSTPAETFGNIKSSFDAPMLMFANPLIDAATSRSDFKLEDVRRRRVSIYFGVTPSKLKDASRLINLFFTQVVALNTSVLPEDDPTLQHQCMLLCDEFTAYGKVSIIVSAISYMAGYNLRMVTIAQTRSQMEGEGLYAKSDAENIVGNHDVRIYFTPDAKDAKEISEMLGTYTKRQTSHSSSRNAHIINISNQGNNSISESDQRRALMMPQELQQLPLSQQLIDKRGLRPVLCQKVVYYADPVFVDRLKRVSASLAQLGAAIPNRNQLDAARNAGELAAPVPTLSRIVVMEEGGVVQTDPTLPQNDLDAFSEMVSRDLASRDSPDAPLFSAQTLQHPAMRVAERLAQTLPDYAAMESIEDFKLEVQRQFLEQVVFTPKGAR